MNSLNRNTWMLNLRQRQEPMTAEHRERAKQLPRLQAPARTSTSVLMGGNPTHQETQAETMPRVRR